VDFGIAKVYDPKLKTTIGAQAVTEGYSPPEQYGQGSTDARSDIYSLGATFYTLLTCSSPANSVDLLAGNQPPPTPASIINSSVSPALEAAIICALQLNRSQRFQSMEEFKSALHVKQNQIQTSPLTKPKTKKYPLFRNQHTLSIVLIL
jgi:serine/threonine protein kinase